jgi:hypothetical protein
MDQNLSLGNSSGFLKWISLSSQKNLGSFPSVKPTLVLLHLRYLLLLPPLCSLLSLQNPRNKPGKLAGRFPVCFYIDLKPITS